MVDLQINYIHHQQLSSFYVGVELLRQAGKIKVDFKFDAGSNSLPLLYGHLNGKSFCIDCLDGLNWILGSKEDNLGYFKSQINADFIFKRSFSPDLISLKPNSHVRPFGFNHALGLTFFPKIYQFSQFLKNPYWSSRYYRLLAGYFDYRTFEVEPILPKNIKIFFQVRLWDPDEAKDLLNADMRTQINNFRVNCVRALKMYFPNFFLGGVADSFYARQICPDLILDSDHTRREYYFSLLRQSSIGIATTGLHNSIGWKMGEYIAASRAIISEPLYYHVPGDFETGKNFLGFTSVDELIMQVDKLLTKPTVIQEMMNENFKYYNQYLRPDQLVWNIIKQIQE
ncbi:hypothetical protein [Algoriphagus yeomjeoni]|uniref:Glycosyl transferase family 1 n=1 Tax=Algoriphagus yeomjeoni TaxID=291403 RepID=A0A327NZQ5_9BACT|nr:hypothetical protein [Algoriphagus yeomjeoni]RAI85585.1 hypothetical protein LV83_03665 [Algoriphagus yeomjeoni]